MGRLRLLRGTDKLTIKDTAIATLFDLIVNKTLDICKNGDVNTHVITAMCLITSYVHLPRVAYATPVD